MASTPWRSRQGASGSKREPILIRRAVPFAEISDSRGAVSPLKLNARKHQAPGEHPRGLDNGVGSLKGYGRVPLKGPRAAWTHPSSAFLLGVASM